jgi:hypothetical protein
MKRIIGLVWLALSCAGAAWVEYEMVLRFGSALILFLVGSALAVLSGALICAPEGYERADGFHFRARDQRLRFVPRFWFSQRRVRREWT